MIVSNVQRRDHRTAAQRDAFGVTAPAGARLRRNAKRDGNRRTRMAVRRDLRNPRTW